ncbi:MAG TPA: thioredoxin domain-containing protein [Waterburya sp.]|jgi:thioredoxin-like negative regulator of GroEL
MESILEEVNAQMKQQLQIVRVDSEKYSELASQYHIHPLPTLVLFKTGQPVERIEEENTENLMSAEHLIQRLQSLA